MIDDLILSEKVIAETLRRARQIRGVSLRGLAAESGVSASHILRLESGEYDLRLSTLLKIAGCLGVPPGLIIETGFIVSPGFYAKRLGEQGVSGIASESSHTVRSDLIVFFAQCAVAIAYLLRSSNPAKTAATMTFPFKQLEDEFRRIAKTIDDMGFADRLALMRDLANEPGEVLARENIASVKMAKAFLQIPKRHVRTFSSAPDLWKALS